MMDVTIIIPAYNEEEGIADVIRRLKELYGEHYEILVIDDGSTDKTYEIAKSMNVRVIRHPYNKGYGAALKTGIRNASGEILVFIDADGQHKPEDIDKLLSYIGEYDMVVGDRGQISEIQLIRKIGKKIIGAVANYLAGMKIPDINSGFRAIKKNVAMEFLPILPNTFSFSTTLTLACIKAGYSVKFVPTRFHRRVGKSKIKHFRDGVRFIVLILKTITLFDPLKVFLPTGIIIFSIGAVYALYTAITLFDIAEASVTLIVAGILIFLFGLLADQVSLMRRW